MFFYFFADIQWISEEYIFRILINDLWEIIQWIFKGVHLECFSTEQNKFLFYILEPDDY